MTLVRQATWLFAAALLLAALALAWLVPAAAQPWAQQQLTQRNAQAAHTLAHQMAQHMLLYPAANADGSVAPMQTLAAPFAHQGARITLLAKDGSTLFDLPAAPATATAPAWFTKAWSLNEAVGRASLNDPAGRVGDVQVSYTADAALMLMWRLMGQCLLVWAVFASLALLAFWLTLRAWQRPLLALGAQAAALEHGSFAQTPVPPQPDLAQLARSLNGTAQRLKTAFDAQADQVAMLQRQAQLDVVTGLPLRDHFLGQLQQRLSEPGGPPVALLMLRVLHLDVLNGRLGHAAIDQLLGAIADVVLTYLDRVPGTFGGRLNGSDIALCLPVRGVALETALSLHAALAALPAMRTAGAHAVVGGVDGLHEVGSSAALGAADAALAQAEARADRHGQEGAHPGGGNDSPQDGFATSPAPRQLQANGDSQPLEPGVVVLQQGDQPAVVGGSRAWREQISVALSEGRARLTEFKVVDSAGRVVRLECPLRVQLSAGGEYQAAARWLALAQRSRLMPRVDLMAVDLALQAIARDGVARAVHASLQSLETPGYVDEVCALLLAAPQAAGRLSIEIVEGLRPTARAPLARATAAWRRFGTRVAVEHAGASPQQLLDLQTAGTAYVKVSAQHLRGAAKEAAVRGYARSLVTMIHGLGQQAVAEGVDDVADIAALWHMGFDAATGPAFSFNR
jgi:EAL domain-containing protein (putative c-di-GMP-specific phosphodiesterase class I)/GGDEF domain-containing protein